MKQRFYKGYILVFHYPLGTWDIEYYNHLLDHRVTISYGHFTLGQCVRHIDKHHRPYPMKSPYKFDREGNNT